MTDEILKIKTNKSVGLTPKGFQPTAELKVNGMIHPIIPKVAYIHLEYTVSLDDYLKMFEKREEIPTQEDYDNWCRSQAEDYFSIMLSGDEIRLKEGN